MLAALGATFARPLHTAEGAVARAVVARPPVAPPTPLPPADGKTVEEQVIEIISERTGIDAKRIKRDDVLVKDLAVKPDVPAEIRKDIAKKFAITIPDDEPEKITVVGGVPIAVPLADNDFRKVGTVGQAIDYVDKAVKKKAGTPAQRLPMITAGVRAPILP